MNDRVKQQWRNRRYMAWIALVSGLLIFPWALTKYVNLGAISVVYYGLVTTVLAAYFGFATWHDLKDKKDDE